ncbi:MAG: alpha-1,2-fucosyltransferase [Candidatus Pacearchaeota archaeon]
MIIVEIGRGLGNSMFVYAAGKALAKHHKTELKLDTSYLRSWPRWEKYGGAWYFELGRFNISAKEATKKELRKHVFKTGFRPIDKLIRKYKIFEKRVYYFPSNGDIKDFFRLPNNIFLWGYFGHEKFFRSIKKTIQKEFTLKKEFRWKIKPLLERISKENSVSIHVRRTDVLKLKNGYFLPLGFYRKAVGIIKKKVKNPNFYVFSDDIKWCKKNFKNFGIKMNFVEGFEGYEDFELMRNCKHNILGIGALSWWTGYLNPNKKAVIIATKHFSHFKNAKIDKDFLPKRWIKI